MCRKQKLLEEPEGMERQGYVSEAVDEGGVEFPLS